MNRGSHRIFAVGPLSGVCFNEAPIHESGKYRRLPSLDAGMAGFNEAPIHESGK